VHSCEMSAERKAVVVLGAGLLGQEVANRLANDGSRDFDLVVVDRRQAVLLKIASLRATVQTKWADNFVQIPRGKALKDARFVCAEAVSIDPENREVELDNGETVAYDVLICCTGAQNSIEPPENLKEVDEIKEFFRDRAQKIKNAERIAIIGGGIVAVELAGEIADVYQEKDLHMFTAGSSLCDRSQCVTRHSSAPGRIREKLENLGVKIHFSERKMKEDLERDFDLVLPAVGFKRNNSAYARHWLDDDGSLKVRRTLQLEQDDFVLAGGDIVNCKEEKMLIVGQFHVEVLVSNAKRLLHNRTDLVWYRGPSLVRKNVVVIPIGSKDGVFLTNWISLPARLAVELKGRDLMVHRFFRDNKAPLPSL